jgi:hypothetical protein
LIVVIETVVGGTLGIEVVEVELDAVVVVARGALVVTAVDEPAPEQATSNHAKPSTTDAFASSRCMPTACHLRGCLRFR